MSDLTPVTATFNVSAGTYAEGLLNLTGLTPDEIAELLFSEVVADVTLCREYEKVGDRWVAQS